MDFEWDEHKNLSNISRHRIDFADAAHVFLDENRVERVDNRQAHGEERWQTLGRTDFGVLFVVYTERRGGDVIRLISARLANKKERTMYFAGSFVAVGESDKHGS